MDSIVDAMPRLVACRNLVRCLNPGQRDQEGWDPSLLLHASKLMVEAGLKLPVVATSTLLDRFANQAIEEGALEILQAILNPSGSTSVVGGLGLSILEKSPGEMAAKDLITKCVQQIMSAGRIVADMERARQDLGKSQAPAAVIHSESTGMHFLVDFAHAGLDERLAKELGDALLGFSQALAESMKGPDTHDGVVGRSHLRRGHQRRGGPPVEGQGREVVPEKLGALRSVPHVCSTERRTTR